MSLVAFALACCVLVALVLVACFWLVFCGFALAAWAFVAGWHDRAKAKAHATAFQWFTVCSSRMRKKDANVVGDAR
jgi:hypothetical protein